MPVGDMSAQQNGWGARCPWVKFPNFAMTKAKFRWAEPYEGRNVHRVQWYRARWPWRRLEWRELAGLPGPGGRHWFESSLGSSVHHSKEIFRGNKPTPMYASEKIHTIFLWFLKHCPKAGSAYSPYMKISISCYQIAWQNLLQTK
jgi:hypothetical protein